MAIRSIVLCTLLAYIALAAASPIESSLPENEKVVIEAADPASKNENSLHVEESSSEDDFTIEDSDEGPDSAGFGIKTPKLFQKVGSGLRKTGKIFQKTKNAAMNGLSRGGRAAMNGLKRTGQATVNGLRRTKEGARRTFNNVREGTQNFGHRALNSVRQHLPNKKETASLARGFGKGLKDIALVAIQNTPEILSAVGALQNHNVVYDNGENVDYNNVDEGGNEEESGKGDNKNDDKECRQLALMECLKKTQVAADIIECQDKYVCPN